MVPVGVSAEESNDENTAKWMCSPGGGSEWWGMKILIIEGDPENIEPVSAIFKLRWPACATISTTEGAQGV